MKSKEVLSTTQIITRGYDLLVDNLRKASAFVFVKLCCSFLLLLIVGVLACSIYREAFMDFVMHVRRIMNGSPAELSHMLSLRTFKELVAFTKILWLVWSMYFNVSCVYFFRRRIHGKDLEVKEAFTSKSVLIAFIKVVMFVFGLYLLACLLGFVLGLLSGFFVHNAYLVRITKFLANILLSYLNYRYYFFSFVVIFKPEYSFRETLSYSAKIGEGHLWSMFGIRILFNFATICLRALLIGMFGIGMLICYLLFALCPILPGFSIILFLACLILVCLLSVVGYYVQVLTMSSFTVYTCRLIAVADDEGVNSDLD